MSTNKYQSNQHKYRNSLCLLWFLKVLVRKGGFEPPRLTAPPPQDGASASSATSARGKVKKTDHGQNRPLEDFRSVYFDDAGAAGVGVGEVGVGGAGNAGAGTAGAVCFRVFENCCN